MEEAKKEQLMYCAVLLFAQCRFGPKRNCFVVLWLLLIFQRRAGQTGDEQGGPSL